MTSPEGLPQPDSDPDRLFETARDCYLAAIQDIAKTVESLSPEIGTATHELLTRLRTRLAFDASVKTFEESRDALHHELQTFSEKARRYNQALGEDVTKTLALLAKNEDALSTRNDRYMERLAHFADQMEHVSKSGDLALLAGQAAQLRDFVESMEQDSRDSFSRLHDKMTEFQNKLREVELLASVDPLTGLANRREFDRQLATRIAANRGFCILLFDLNTFKAVNDKFGHLWGDEILRQLGERLSTHVRPRDFVCRWGGDEFVAILECPLANAQARAHEIAQLLGGPYKVMVEGREIRVDTGVSFGVAERIQGETPERLFQRVDDSMYRQKNGQPSDL